MEHWLPLLHDKLVTLFDYIPDGIVVLGHDSKHAREARYELIQEYYSARQEAAKSSNSSGSIYRPIPPDTIFLDEKSWQSCLAKKIVVTLSPFSAIENISESVNFGGTKARDFTDIRVKSNTSIYDAVCEYAASVTRLSLIHI